MVLFVLNARKIIVEHMSVLVLIQIIVLLLRVRYVIILHVVITIMFPDIISVAVSAEVAIVALLMSALVRMARTVFCLRAMFAVQLIVRHI